MRFRKEYSFSSVRHFGDLLIAWVWYKGKDSKEWFRDVSVEVRKLDHSSKRWIGRVEGKVRNIETG